MTDTPDTAGTPGLERWWKATATVALAALAASVATIDAPAWAWDSATAALVAATAATAALLAAGALRGLPPLRIAAWVAAGASLVGLVVIAAVEARIPFGAGPVAVVTDILSTPAGTALLVLAVAAGVWDRFRRRGTHRG